jgi:hypothetical protein
MGGQDTADFTDRANKNWTINLSQTSGYADSGGGGRDLLFGIESVVLGSGKNTVTLPTGNIDNVINGNLGKDDTVILPYAFGQWNSISGNVNDLTITGSAGTDRFIGIENFKFSDGDKTAAQTAAQLHYYRWNRGLRSAVWRQRRPFVEKRCKSDD